MLGSLSTLVVATAITSCQFVSAAVTNGYADWKRVNLGAGGGFVTGIVFNTKQKGVAYARTDIGGAYKLNPADDTWIPLQDGTTIDTLNDWGVDGIATDSIEPSRVYLLTGLYTNGWDANNGSVLRSDNYGNSWTRTRLPFKVGGNMYGRGLGERIMVDPNKGSILYLGARSGNGLWKSTNFGQTWAKVSSFTQVGNWPVQDPNGNNPYGNPNVDFVGITWITFDTKSGKPDSPTPRIFVGVGNNPGDTIFVSKNAGATWAPLAGQPSQGYFPHKCKISPKENVMYISYGTGPGPNDVIAGAVWRYNLTDSTWLDISPQKDSTFGYGGLSVDLQKPGTLMVAAVNQWWPDGQIWRSVDSGKTWKPFWTWGNYPTINWDFDIDISNSPWMLDFTDGSEFRRLVGHWMESLEIDPFNSNHFLYGTGVTVMGSKNLLDWDDPVKKKFKLSSLAVGMEETAILDLQCPQSGPPLISAMGDLGGLIHLNVNDAPKKIFGWGTKVLVDYAGKASATMIRAADTLDVSYNAGANWTLIANGPSGVWGGSIAVTADGHTIVWRASNGQAARSVNAAAFEYNVVGLPTDAYIAADKRNSSRIYGASGSSFYFSQDGGLNFALVSAFSTTGTVNDVTVHPFASGDVWISASDGVYHSTLPFTTWIKAKDIVQAHQISLGAPKKAGGYPPTYLFGFDSARVQGVYRTDDQGKNWVRMNDNKKKGFGDIKWDPLAADTQRWGRVYTGTNGRGISYADAK